MGERFEYVTRIKGISSKKRATQQRLLSQRELYFEKLLKGKVRLEPIGYDEQFKVMVTRG